MTDRIKEIRDRLAAATPGPWFHRQAGEHHPRDPKHKYDWVGDHPDQGKHKKVIVPRNALYGGTPDYAFVANAPDDIAFLLFKIEKLQKRLGIRKPK